MRPESGSTLGAISAAAIATTVSVARRLQPGADFPSRSGERPTRLLEDRRAHARPQRRVGAKRAVGDQAEGERQREDLAVLGPEAEISDAEVVDRRLRDTDSQARGKSGPRRAEPDDQGRDEPFQPEQGARVDRERRGRSGRDGGERGQSRRRRRTSVRRAPRRADRRTALLRRPRRSPAAPARTSCAREPRPRARRAAAASAMTKNERT